MNQPPAREAEMLPAIEPTPPPIPLFTAIFLLKSFENAADKKVNPADISDVYSLERHNIRIYPFTHGGQPRSLSTHKVEEDSIAFGTQTVDPRFVGQITGVESQRNIGFLYKRNNDEGPPTLVRYEYAWTDIQDEEDATPSPFPLQSLGSMIERHLNELSPSQQQGPTWEELLTQLRKLPQLGRVSQFLRQRWDLPWTLLPDQVQTSDGKILFPFVNRDGNILLIEFSSQESNTTPSDAIQEEQRIRKLLRKAPKRIQTVLRRRRKADQRQEPQEPQQIRHSPGFQMKVLITDYKNIIQTSLLRLDYYHERPEEAINNHNVPLLSEVTEGIPGHPRLGDLIRFTILASYFIRAVETNSNNQLIYNINDNNNNGDPKEWAKKLDRVLEYLTETSPGYQKPTTSPQVRLPTLRILPPEQRLLFGEIIKWFNDRLQELLTKGDTLKLTLDASKLNKLLYGVGSLNIEDVIKIKRIPAETPSPSQ